MLPVVICCVQPRGRGLPAPGSAVVTLYIAQILFFPSQSPFTGMFVTKTEDWQGGYGRVVE